MAKSFSKGKTSMFDDDSIKEALKSELMSIRASEELLGKTLVKCRDEIARNQHMNRRKNFAFVPLLYKVGAPIAAGALIVVLALNIGNPMKHNNATAAPEAAGIGMASAAPSAADGILEDQSAKMTSSIAANETPAATDAPAEPKLQMQFAQNAADTAQPLEGSDDKHAGELQSNEAQEEDRVEKLDGFNSSANRTSNELAAGESESLEIFETVVTQYTASKGLALGLYEDGIIRVQTLKTTGYDIQNLLNIKSYRELLSGEGYWALPLADESGQVITLLAVNLVDRTDPDLSLTDRDIIVNIKDKDYLISVYTDFDPNAQGLLFDAGELLKIVKEKGYQEIKEISAVDIYYGLDFMIFVEADNRELVVPVLRDATAVGLVNNRVYTKEELMRALSLFLSQSREK